MGQILVRNLDDRVIDTYKWRARMKGISLEQEVRDVLNAHRRLTPEEKVAISREVLEKTPGLVPELTAEERREGLE